MYSAVLELDTFVKIGRSYSQVKLGIFRVMPRGFDNLLLRRSMFLLIKRKT